MPSPSFSFKLHSLTVGRGGKLGFSSGKKFVGSTYNNSTQSTIADVTMDVVVLESQKVDGGKHLEGPFFFLQVKYYNKSLIRGSEQGRRDHSTIFFSFMSLAE